jgi:antitoxin ParD1/3/4
MAAATRETLCRAVVLCLLSEIDNPGHAQYLRGEAAGGHLMNVHLTPELEQLVHGKVQSGRYNSASEVVREALRLMDERDQLVALRKEEYRRKIAEGLESLRRGEGIDGEKFFQELERRESNRRLPGARKRA